MAVAVCSALAVGPGAAPAPAAPDTAGAAAAIEANGRRADSLSEALNGAQYRLDQAQATLDASRTRGAELRARIAADRALLATQSAGIYRSAGAGGLLRFLDLSALATTGRRLHYGAAAATATQQVVSRLVAAQAALARTETDAEQAQRAAREERDRLVRARAELAAADARQQALLAQAPPDVTRGLGDAQSTAVANAVPAPTPTTPTPSMGAPAAAPTPSPARSPAPAPAPPVAPAPNGGAAAAVAFAYAQLGKPYVYAAAGPDAYDCSGLTMAAWRAGGVSLPHYSGAQYSRLRKVPMSALLPGDLVFWGPGGSDHVAIYVGAGKIISAPYTGAVVRLQGIWGSPVGAARP
jgi:cell wall-associated NlpC family hydrolase